MIRLHSPLSHLELQYSDLKSHLTPDHFVLGGNWDYYFGCFDRSLDREQKVWLRIPFKVLEGRLCGEKEHVDAYIKIGNPFVLNHLYEEGNSEADAMTIGALFNQFQPPADPDAPVDDEWIVEAKKHLNNVEKRILS